MTTGSKLATAAAGTLMIFSAGAYVGYEHAEDKFAGQGPPQQAAAVAVTTAPPQAALPPVAATAPPAPDTAPTPFGAASPSPAADESGLTPIPAAAMNAPLRTLDGRTVRLADYAGRPVVVEMWASWCPTCRAAMPDMNALRQEFAGEPVEFLALTPENPDTERDAVQKAVNDLGMDHATVAFVPRETAKTFARLEGDGIPMPQTLVLTPTGRVAEHVVGFRPSRDPAALRAAIRRFSPVPTAAATPVGSASVPASGGEVL